MIFKKIFIHQGFYIDQNSMAPQNNIVLFKMKEQIDITSDGNHYTTNNICLPVKAVLIGIASYVGKTEGGADHHLSAFEPVSHHIEWILNTIEKN